MWNNNCSLVHRVACVGLAQAVVTLRLGQQAMELDAGALQVHRDLRAINRA
jgi:hypothetical protein